MGVQGGAARRRIFLVRQKAFELLIFLLPSCIFGIKCLRQTAPADVSGEDFLLVRARLPALRFNLLERLDGGNVERILRLCAAFAQMVIRDAEIMYARLFGFCAGFNRSFNIFLRLLIRRFGVIGFDLIRLCLPLKQKGISRIFSEHPLEVFPRLYP